MWTPRLEAGSAEPLYRQIVQALADDVAGGALAAEAQLPPHRELCEQLRCARGTVARAYLEAERLGLVRSGVGQGTYVLPPAARRPYDSLLEPPTVVADVSSRMFASQLDALLAAGLKRVAGRPDRAALLRYHPPQGLLRHRLAGAQWFKRLGVSIAAEDVLVCSGAQHGLFVALSHLSGRGKPLYCEELSYPGLVGVIETLGLKCVPLKTGAGGIDVADLRRSCQRHGPGVLYLMPTQQNPLGVVLSRSRRIRLVEVARAGGLWLIEDEANRVLQPDPPLTLFELAPERTVLLASVSKLLSPGLRVGFMGAPHAEVPALTRRSWATQWMNSPLGVELVAGWLEDGVVARAARQRPAHAAARQRLLRRVFRGRNVVASPYAAYAWVPYSWRCNLDRMMAVARSADIVATPAAAFWLRDSPPPRAVRLSLATPRDLRHLERGLRQLARVMSTR